MADYSRRTHRVLHINLFVPDPKTLQSADACIVEAAIQQRAAQRSRAISSVRTNGNATCAACRPGGALPLDDPRHRIGIDGHARRLDAAHDDLAAWRGAVSALALDPFAGDARRRGGAGNRLRLRGTAALLIRCLWRYRKQDKEGDEDSR